ncbi:DUF547 domain-containing protein [Novipirellula caenicola]|uniref:DUF547 domain-containing protein n=1 Tax=Novipirellula caenicola TaxID=1536901 RepID=A0ABP9VKP4_9BACT
MVHPHAKTLAVALFVTLIGGLKGYAASPIYVGTQVSSHLSMDRIDHSHWNLLLRKYVDGNGMVNYKALKASGNDVQMLNRYLKQLSVAGVTTPASKDATLAFWINAYNALTVHGILREYPTTSIRNHTAKLWGYNLWKDLQLYVGGKPYSLEQIEHEVLRKMDEPRIHFAIVCASMGCPRLLNEAYVADRVQQQLELNTKDFFARTQNFQYDADRGEMELSAILSWFSEDFGKNQVAALQRIAPWLPTEEARDAALQNTTTVGYLEYDWNLNAQ